MTSGVLSQVLLSLAFVVAIARVGGYLSERAGQPPVVGEIVAGVLLRPVTARLGGAPVGRLLLPAGVTPYLTVVAQLGLAVFMLIVGIEVDIGTLSRRRSRWPPWRWARPRCRSCSVGCWRWRSGAGTRYPQAAVRS